MTRDSEADSANGKCRETQIKPEIFQLNNVKVIDNVVCTEKYIY